MAGVFRAFLHFEDEDDDTWEDDSAEQPDCSIAPYRSARALVADGNRQGAWIAWTPSHARWEWKHNDRHRSYCGKITLMAVDRLREELHVFVHAASTYPDLRAARTSSIYAQSARRGRYGKVESMHVCRLITSSPQRQQAVLTWPLAGFRHDVGSSFFFCYATSHGSPEHSDYPLVPLFRASDQPTAGQFPETIDLEDLLRPYPTSEGFRIVGSDHQEDLFEGASIEQIMAALRGTAVAPPRP